MMFSELPTHLQTDELAAVVGASVIGGEWTAKACGACLLSNKGLLAYVCAWLTSLLLVRLNVAGSPGEVANDATKGHNYPLMQVTRFGSHPQGSVWYYSQLGMRRGQCSAMLNDPLGSSGGVCIDMRAETVFTNVVVKSEDQLRQRVGWALAQLYPIGELCLRNSLPLGLC